MWETNFIKDVRSFELAPDEKRGGSKLTNFELCNNIWKAHISQFKQGTYKKAHRHGPAATILIIDGKGYSLMWLDGQPKQRFDWKEGSIVVPPENWYHQHFNTGHNPAKYIAISYHGKKYRFMKRWEGYDKDQEEGGSQIEFCNEDPEIRRMFEDELAKDGLKSKMNESIYKKLGS